jgi:hypothetical protein
MTIRSHHISKTTSTKTFASAVEAKKRMSDFPLIVLEWDDHQTSCAEDWFSDKESAVAHFGSMTVHSVGWLIHEDDKSYLLTSMIAVDDGRMAMLVQILKSTVISKKVLCS